MATRSKTTQFAFPVLASLTNNSLTALTGITVYIPESSPVFRSVTAHVTYDDIITVTGGSQTTKTIGLSLGAVGYTTIANANGLTHNSENISNYITGDFTSYFTTNWTGTSMACGFELQINQSTGTTLGQVNVCVTLDITYEYDDTSTTHIKTVHIPLNAPVTVLATTPTTYDTIPALSYYLAEPNKTIRSAFVVVEANTCTNGGTTDTALSIAVGAASTTSGNLESGLASDRRIRYVWELSASWPSLTATQNFQLSDTVGMLNHPQAYLVVTYEFKANASATTLTAALVDGSGTTVSVTSAAALGTAPFVISIDNEQMLVTSIASNDLTVTRAYNGTTGVAHSNGATVSPCATNAAQLIGYCAAAAFGGTTSGDYNRATASVYIEEPGPITGGKIAWFGQQSDTALAGVNLRLGTGSFVAYTDGFAQACGDLPHMVRNDAAYTLARGVNTFTADAYRTSGASGSQAQGRGFSGYFMITYVSTKSSAGYGAHLQTRRRLNSATGTAASAGNVIYAASAIEIPESDYYISNCGLLGVVTGGAAASGPQQSAWSIERLAAEGGVRWDHLWSTTGYGSHPGTYMQHMDLSRLMKRWPLDTGFERMDIETSRRVKRMDTNTAPFSYLAWWCTYASCGPFLASGTVSNSAGGTVTLGLHRSSDGQLLKSTTRSGNGAYSFNWWDNTENVFVEALEDATHLGRSADGTAAGSA